MDIAKVTKVEEFLKVLQAYRDQLSDPKAMASLLGEMRTKLDSFMNKHLVKVNKQALKNADKLSDLLDFLMIIDREMPYEDFFQHSGLETFSTLFKLTFYQQDYAVVNQDLKKGQYLDLRILEHEEVKSRVESLANKEAKCNFVVNNILAKMLFNYDKQKLLMQVAELMYSTDTVVSTQKVAKLLVYFGKLFEVVTH